MKINEKFIIREINREMILVNKYENNEIYKFNSTSKFIISLIMNNKNKNEIIDELCDKYNIEKERATKDTINFIEEIKALGILV